MWADLAWIILGLLMLLGGAEVLVRGASGLALHFGISPLMVGLTIVAFGTSSPELMVCVKDTLKGQGELALGTVVGSNICNIVLILGVCCLIHAIVIHRRLFTVDIPIMLAATLALPTMLHFGGLSRLDGALLTAGIIAYVVFAIHHARQHPEDAEDVPAAPQNMLLLVAFCVVGPLLLSKGADFILLGGRSIASAYGVSEAVIGLTLVAFGSSLPELATGVVAASKRQGDLIVGNVIGSNIFNILCVLGITSLIGPIPFTGITWIDLGFMISVSALLVPIILMRRFVLHRWEGLLMLCGYAGYLYYIASTIKGG